MKKVVLGLAVITAMMASAGDTQAEQKKAGKSGKATVQKRVAAKKTQAGDAQQADSKLKELEEANKKLEKEKAEMQETMGKMEKHIRKQEEEIAGLCEELWCVKDENEKLRDELGKK